nr:hypothetical protein [uncultured Butyrivibrio sp.]
MHDRKHYKELLRKAAIASDAHNFLSSYKQQLEEAESISTDAFRLLKYENLIDEFTKGKEIKEKPIKDGDNAKPNFKPHNTMKVFEDEHKDIYIDLLCSRDKTKMHVTKFAKFKRNGDKKIITFPIYECPACGKLYTSLSIYPNKHQISVSGKIYTNLTSKFNRADHANHNLLKERLLVKANFFIHDQKAIKCVNKDCKNHELQTIPIVLKTKKGKKTIQKVKWCNKCNAYYFPISQLDFYDFPYDIINKTELPEIEAQYIKRTNENAERKRIQEENKRLAAEALYLRRYHEYTTMFVSGKHIFHHFCEI